MSTKRNTRTEISHAKTSTVPSTVPVPKKKRKTVSQVLPQELPQESVFHVFQVFQDSQKTLKKIINQNSKIVQKLDQMISGQKSLENRITN